MDFERVEKSSSEKKRGGNTGSSVSSMFPQLLLVFLFSRHWLTEIETEELAWTRCVGHSRPMEFTIIAI